MRSFNINCLTQRVLNDYRGPGFLADVWFGSYPHPFPSPVSRKLTRPATHRKLRRRDNLLMGEGGGGGGGAKSCDSKEAWFSINNSILPGLAILVRHVSPRDKVMTSLLCLVVNAILVSFTIVNLHMQRLSTGMYSVEKALRKVKRDIFELYLKISRWNVIL